MTLEDWECISQMHPELEETGAAGCYDDGAHIVIFLARLSGDIIPAMIDCWLHEFLELQCDEVEDHEAFNSTVTRIARYVSAL